MTKEEKKRLYQCRYFANQEKNPHGSGFLAWCWDMEATYVYGSGMSPEMDEYYKNIGGKDYDGIPHELLIILFTSWAKGSYDKKKDLPFFYKVIDEYLDIPSDEIPKDKIPNIKRG